MVAHVADRQFAIKGYRLEILLGDAGQLKAGMSLETKAPIVARITKQDTTTSALAPQISESRCHQQRADALFLPIGPYGDGSEAIPSSSARRKRDR